ncbi:hypothetical protein ACTA71_000902 [Dictyostelium dimigraforme]
MKFLAIVLILVSILGLSNAYTTQHINARIYCGGNCGNSTKTSDISITVNECRAFPKEDTCATPASVYPQLVYNVVASFGCSSIQASSDQVIIGVCNTFTKSGYQFSIMAESPADGPASSSNSLKPIVLLSALVFLIVSLVI